MALDYSYLSEVFLNYSNSSEQIIDIPNPPPEYSPPYEKILNLQPNEKLRIVDGILEIDRRSFSGISRKYTRDSRWKILEKILEIKNVNIREFYLGILRSSTYSRDEKWIETSERKF